jgi:maleylacetoacetate isomerase
MNIELYHYWRSSASWRVRWALELKKVPHKKTVVNLLQGEEKNPDYLKRNPSGYLPCLVVDGKPMGESMAILEWLEETFPQPSFFAGDSFQRAFIRQLAETVNSGTQPLQNLDVMKKVSPDAAAQKEWVRHWIIRGMEVYEKMIKPYEGKKFSVSDTPTLADLCLIPQCHAAVRFEVALEAYPRCKSIYENALATPECEASRPEKFQPKT